MRLTKFTWLLVAVGTIIYTATLVIVRVENPRHIQAECYRRWRSAYVIKQSPHRAFVNTSNQRNNPVALSEGQGYGLYITAPAGTVGRSPRTLTSPCSISCLAHRDYVGPH
ncbi:hypothetical protein [Limosilactobacillus pontis]|uniref:Secreted protein n=1 Tax=Limosilactobacillus pontis TaxID=35787 RepID=A0ABU7SRA3_9LACO